MTKKRGPARRAPVPCPLCGKNTKGLREHLQLSHDMGGDEADAIVRGETRGTQDAAETAAGVADRPATTAGDGGGGSSVHDTAAEPHVDEPAMPPAAAELLREEPADEPAARRAPAAELHELDDPADYERAAEGLVRQVDRIAAKASRGRVPRESPQDLADTVAGVTPMVRHAGQKLGPAFWFWSGVLVFALFIVGKLLAMMTPRGAVELPAGTTTPPAAPPTPNLPAAP